MPYQVWAITKEWDRQDTVEHLFGTYDTKQLAEWWAINGKTCWDGGVNGPRTKLAKEVLYMEIREVP